MEIKPPHIATRPGPHVGIIILNWNGLKDTMECLISVFKNDYPNYSIYVVDNASEKDELSEIRKALQAHKGPKAPTFFIQNKKNLGFAGGNNVGIHQALEKESEYIFLLNNDTTIDRSFLTEAVKALSMRLLRPFDRLRARNDSAPRIGIVATTMINYYKRTKLDNIGHDLLTTGDTIPRKRNARIPNPNSQKTKRSLDIGHWTLSPPMGACAGAALYSSKMLKEIGLLDEEFFLNYEDSDLSLRAIVQGWQCIWAPESKVYHKINASIKKIKDTEYSIRSQRNQFWAYLHNTPFLVIILNLPWIILRDLLIFVLSILTFRWGITKIFVYSRFQVLKTLPRILKKRRKVLKHQKISSWWFWRHQKSWLSTYWQYFKDIVIKRKDSVMD